MNVTNIMNFVRTFEPRNQKVELKLFDAAAGELALCEELGLPSTFLLEYDALCDERYVELFRGASDNIELGLWYEIVEPLTTDIGIPYNSERGWRWDWHIIPGFSMAYDNPTKEKLIDQAMKKFREVFGYYPRTVASWAIDTHTMNHLAEHYDIDAIAICRDEVNTDAYTFVGGYFNGIYFPSKNNIHTPARVPERQCKVPVIRLLGPDPIHNYDNKKHLPEEAQFRGVCTLEAASPLGSRPEVVDWFFKTFYDNENLGFGYTQLGQENSFAMFDLVTPLRMQCEKLMRKGTPFMKMGDTGAMFKKLYSETPATAVCAFDSWEGTDERQSIFYDSKNYTINIFRNGGRVTVRAFYLFDDKIPDIYLTESCTTFDCIFENMPIVDTFYQRGEGDGGCGMILAENSPPITAEKTGEGVLTVKFGDGSAVLSEDSVILSGCSVTFTPEMVGTKIEAGDGVLLYEYKGHRYTLRIAKGSLTHKGDTFKIEGDEIVLIPEPKE